MSVLRRLVEQQLSITPSMECLSIEQHLNTLQGQFVTLVDMLPMAANGDLSMESSSYLSAIGYSTEADDKKSFLRRVWDGIKATFQKIKAMLNRLFSARYQRLKGNSFKIEKLKKYIHNIDATTKPQGDMIWSPTLLPNEPGHVADAIHKFRTQAHGVIEHRHHAVQILGGLGLDDNAKVTSGIESLYKGEDVLNTNPRAGSAVFNNTAQGNMRYTVRMLSNSSSSIRVQPASVVLMSKLVAEFESLTEDDKKLVSKMVSDQAEFDRVEGKLDDAVGELLALMDSAATRRTEMDGAYHEKKKTLTARADEAKKISYILTDVQRITHMHIYETLYSDLESVLQASLGSYRFKKHELLPEDQGRKNHDHDYR